MKNKKFATLFGGAMNNTESTEYKQTVEIGRLLAQYGYIVKNGGYRGMMEAVSKGAAEAGGVVIGLTVEAFGSTVGNEYLTYNIPQKDLYDRLRKLIDGTDIFIVQKGGIGTIAELFLTLDIVRKIKRDKPRIFLFGEEWRNMEDFLVLFARKKELELYIIVDDLEQFENILNVMEETKN